MVSLPICPWRDCATVTAWFCCDFRGNAPPKLQQNRLGLPDLSGFWRGPQHQFYCAILLVRNLERSHAAFLGQAASDPVDMLINSTLPPADLCVSRTLQHPVAVLFEELAKLAGSPSLCAFVVTGRPTSAVNHMKCAASASMPSCAWPAEVPLSSAAWQCRLRSN